MVLGSLALAATAYADVDVDLGAEVRWRPETERVLVRAGSESRIEAQQLLRTRVRADFAPGERTSAHLVIQDARILGEPRSGAVAGDQSLGVHEAYLSIDDFLVDGVDLQAGRFVMNHGDQRLVGEVGWSNTGRSFDAVRLRVEGRRGRIDLFGAKIVSRNTGPNQDHTFYGAHTRLADSGAEAFAYWDYDGRTVGPDEDRRLDRWTVGVHAARRIGTTPFDYVVNGAYQLGSFVAESDTTGTDIGAYLLTAEIGYDAPTRTPVRVAAGIDLASGNDPTQDEFGGFDNLYYTGHKFRGWMDQFLASDPPGLVDIYGRLRFEPRPKWAMALDIHRFGTHRDFTSLVDGDSTSRTVALEIDASVTTRAIDHAAVQVGGAAFLPDEDWAGEGNDDARLWGYLQVTVTLP
jgi:hypothetical protein